MLQLFQAEWCPYSHRVRERLTELGVDFVARQVAPRRPDRTDMKAATGTVAIPALLTEEGETIEGDTAIIAFLEANYGRGQDWELGHQEKEASHPTLRQGASRDPS
jgi:glutathione S-transferase